MKVNRKEFLNILSAVLPGVGGGLEQSKCFVFRNNRIMTKSDDIAVQHKIDGLDFEGAVQAEEFYKLLKDIPEDELNLSLGDGKILIVTKTVKSDLNLMEANLPFDDITFVKNEVMDLPENFCEAIKACQFSASKDTSQILLMHLNILNDRVISCDAKRLTEYKLSSEMGLTKDNVMLSAAVVDEICKYEPKKYFAGDNWISFWNGKGVMFSCRTIDGSKYPSIEKVKEDNKVKGKTLVLPEELNTALKPAGIFSKASFRSTEAITISIKNNVLIVSSKNEVGSFNKRMKIDFPDELSFMINPHFLEEVLKLSSKITIGNGMLKIEGKRFIHITCLLSKED